MLPGSHLLGDGSLSDKHGDGGGLSGGIVFLVNLVALILYLNFNILFSPSIYSLIQYGKITCSLILIVTLILFFATGMYAEKITYANKLSLSPLCSGSSLSPE